LPPSSRPMPTAAGAAPPSCSPAVECAPILSSSVD
jgi:hypothetical protein